MIVVWRLMEALRHGVIPEPLTIEIHETDVSCASIIPPRSAPFPARRHVRTPFVEGLPITGASSIKVKLNSQMVLFRSTMSRSEALVFEPRKKCRRNHRKEKDTTSRINPSVPPRRCYSFLPRQTQTSS
jgi:hypothetical protein